MDKEYYDKVNSVVPVVDVVDTLMSQLRNALQDAVVQAENGSELGVATAVGKASVVLDELSAAWLAIKG